MIIWGVLLMMLSKAKVVEFKPDTKYQHPKSAFPHLPQHEFLWMIVAPCGGGKTNLLCNLLTNHYKGYFHKVYWCSPSVENDPKLDKLKTTKGILCENPHTKDVGGSSSSSAKSKHDFPKVVHGEAVRNWYDHRPPHGDEKFKVASRPADQRKFTGRIPDECFMTSMNDIIPIFENAKKDIEKLKKEHGPKAKYMADRMLIILDDQAGNFKGGKTNNPMSNMVLHHRHGNASLIICTQENKSIPNTIRINAKALTAFEIADNKEVESLYKEWQEFLQFDQWETLLNYATSEPYSFLFINRQAPRGERFYKKFDQPLATPASSSKKSPSILQQAPAVVNNSQPAYK